MQLESLGLTGNESKAYETILHLGKTTAAQISKESRIPYGRIYTVLASLEEKNLIKTIPEPTKQFLASDPEKLHEIIQEKKKALEDIELKIKEFKTIYSEQGTEPVQIVKGKGNFMRISREMQKPKKSEYTIKYNFYTHPELIRDHRRLLKSGINIKTLGRIDEETKSNLQKWKSIDKSIKPIRNSGIAISIHDDNEMMITMIKSNLTMLIKDKPFIEIMRQLFEAYYEKAEK